MPRPRKWKNVCCLPENKTYGPLDETKQREPINMSVEAYETIRLIDLEGLTQEACAERMQVARATVQKLYVEARHIIAQSLVFGHLIQIEGGDYKLYGDQMFPYGCSRCKPMEPGRRYQKRHGHLDENSNPNDK